MREIVTSPLVHPRFGEDDDSSRTRSGQVTKPASGCPSPQTVGAPTTSAPSSPGGRTVTLPVQPGLGDLSNLAGLAGAESPSSTRAGRSVADVATPSAEARVDTAITAADVATPSTEARLDTAISADPGNSQSATVADRSAADAVAAAADATAATQTFASVNLPALQMSSSGLRVAKAARATRGSQGSVFADALTTAELSRVSEMVGNMADARQLTIVDASNVAERLASGGYDVAALQDSLQALDATIEDVVNAVGGDAANLGNIEDALNDLLSDPSSLEALSFEAGQVIQAYGVDLQTVADAIADLLAAGVSVDLEALAEGAGFSSFADAVDAYNEAYGTNFSEQDALDALGGDF